MQKAFSVTNKSLDSFYCCMILLSSNEKKKKRKHFKILYENHLYKFVALPGGFSFIPVAKETKLRIGFNPQFTYNT